MTGRGAVADILRYWHAVEMFETDSMPDHTVMEEYQRGYNFKGKLLRPAMVKVAVKP